ncbi:hypothetical protein MSG28_010214 [Choristoneura fumiferana]|uniref:Uncharacterized protein n=1 Tax=Choristoneura fumiferana TaxID=7141 RepID=A0ACC0KKA4_CHOFU|nr:hypothetical protein MSG28_010214 [Choristoneura fumiferana]
MKVHYFGITILVFKLMICESAKILYIMPFTAKSHYIGMKNLAVELASRGHDVYAITPFREAEHPQKYTQLMVSNISLWEKLFDVTPRVFEMMDYSFESYQMILYRSGFMVNELVFDSPDVQMFLKQNHKIDLVVTEIFFNEGLYMFAHKYQAPLVLVTTVGNSFKGNYYMRNPLQLSTLFHEYGRSTEPLSFLGRLYNFYICSYDLLMLKFWYFPRQQESALHYFKDLPQPVPSLEEIQSNAALVLLNSHYSLDNPSAYLPNIIEVGGLHIKESNETLPKDLQNILDNAKDGVVFLSFGSNVQTRELDKDKLDAFLKVFGELKQTVLMKWEDSPMQNLPKNVILRKWFQQKAVLGHPNVKLFIGHGGLLGLQETISAGVPILGVPVFGDQFLNIIGTVQNGHGEILYYKEINEHVLRDKINKMLTDRRYIETARKVAMRFKDRPMKAMDTAKESALHYFKDLPQTKPSLEEIAANAALVLLNSHYSMDNPSAYLPNIIEVGGLHIKETNETLPVDLPKVLDNAKNGVVFLSFGSNVQLSELDKDKLDAFLKVFGELKQTVLMKWEDAPIQNIPKNIVLRKWFPQKAVLVDVTPRVFEMMDYSFESYQMILYRSGFMVNELVFESLDVQMFLKQNHKIDLVVTEIFFNEGLYMFAHKYQAPLVLVTTVGNSFKGNYYMRNPLQLSTLFHEYGRAKEPLSFLGRLYNFYICFYDLLMLKFWYFPRQQESALHYFKDLPQPVPSLEEIQSNAALVLLNSHYSLDNPSAYLPNIIEVGGLHIKESNETLPKDLQNILDNAKDGVIFLSFGSNVQIRELDKDKLDAFLKVFGELKQTVLMKWEDSPMQNLPKNVILRKWFQQKAVLGHPNVKLFIGHGGLLGLQETISAGVPILGVPVFGDQFLNIIGTVQNGHGEILYYKEINEHVLRDKINKMLTDRRYIETARKVAMRFKDRPMKAMDTAVWWTESHYIGMKNLALELASRGHDVYAITPFREPEAPLTYHQLMPKVFDMIDYSFESFQTITAKSGFLVNEHVFESEDVQNFLKQDHKIDLVITEIFFNEGLYMFAHKYQAPLVLVTTVGNSFKGNYYMRNPLQLSTLFHEYGRASEPLSFLGRFYNMYLCTFDLLMLKFWYFPRQQESALRYFKDLPQPVPNLEDIAANAALLLLNSHFSIDNPSAYLPNIIEVGGLHIKDTNDTLPADLQNVLDNAKNGVVFLSFGSNVQLSELDKDKLDAFLKVFGELKQTVLMKWEDVPIQNIPKNIVLRKWFPQKAVLAHHNVKLFIGHGGLLGLQETISAGVPILGVPVFGDQYLNILDTVRKGHGEILYYKEINENTLRTKINKMLKDRTYMETAKKIAARFKDRPMNPLDTAVWWTEYVIRHKGADFMKPPKISYIAYQMLDVYLFLLGVVAVIIYVILKVITLIINVFGSKNVTKKQKKT